MERYEKYKPSGIEWIGEVPEHWKKCRFKNFLTLVTKPSESSVKIGLENIEGQTGRFIPTDSDFEGNGTEFKVGDIVYGKLRPYLQKVWLAEFDGNAVGDFFVFRNRENCDAHYLKYLLLSDGYTKEANSATEGAKMPRVPSDFILSLRYYIPLVAEQEAIAAYLDARCADIDKVVVTQEKRIALLKELKQSVITQAVTRGLNTDVKMKDSGVEWIGEVPEHWEVMPFKFRMNINNGMDYKHIQVDDGYPVMGSGGQFAYASQYMYDGEVVLLGRKGTVDKPLYFNGKFWAVDTMFYAIPLNETCCKYMYYQATTFPFNYYQTATALPSMTQTDLGNNHVCVPPISEQKAIADYLDNRCGEIDQQINNVTHQIDLLREYKQSLITEVVTGKRKVC